MSSLETRLAELQATGGVNVTALKSPAGHGQGHGHGHDQVDTKDDTKRRVSLG